MMSHILTCSLVTAVVLAAGSSERAAAQVVPRPLPPIVRPIPRPQPPPRPTPVVPPGIRNDFRPPVYPRPVVIDEDDKGNPHQAIAVLIVVGFLVVLGLILWAEFATERSKHERDSVRVVSPGPAKCPRCDGTGKVWLAIDGGPWESQDTCPSCQGAGRPPAAGRDPGRS